MSGRKGKFEEWLTEQGLTLVEGWARDGLSEKDIAQHKLHISEKTINEWKNRFPQFREALKKGKELPDYQVENALFKSACGYYVEESEDKIDMHGNVVPTTRRRFIPPNTAAQIFWLKNRRPDKWKDKPTEVEDASIESDGLIEALNKTADSPMSNDIAMIPQEDEQ